MPTIRRVKSLLSREVINEFSHFLTARDVLPDCRSVAALRGGHRSVTTVVKMSVYEIPKGVWNADVLAHKIKAGLGGHMKRFVVGILAAAVLVLMARTAMGQAKTVTSEMRTETATVEAIDAASRSVTLRKSDGTVVTTVAGPEIKRFEEVKVGDKITARYYENMVIRVRRPGEPEVDSKVKGTTGSEQVLPGGTKARQRTMPATITAIDMDKPSITFTGGEKNWKYTSTVQDKSALAAVKVGDKVEIVWTEAMLVSLERPQ
jgi:Cu/Ag efflux protein CusF